MAVAPHSPPSAEHPGISDLARNPSRSGPTSNGTAKGPSDFGYHLLGRPSFGEDVYANICQYHTMRGGKTRLCVDLMGDANAMSRMSTYFDSVVSQRQFRKRRKSNMSDSALLASGTGKQGTPLPTISQGQAWGGTPARSDSTAGQIPSAEPEEQVVESRSADLVTAFMCSRWSEPRYIMRKAARMLRPGGTLALVSYSPKGYLQHPAQARVEYDELISYVMAKIWADDEHDAHALGIADDDDEAFGRLGLSFRVHDEVRETLDVNPKRFADQLRLLWSSEGMKEPYSPGQGGDAAALSIHTTGRIRSLSTISSNNNNNTASRQPRRMSTAGVLGSPLLIPKSPTFPSPSLVASASRTRCIVYRDESARRRTFTLSAFLEHLYSSLSLAERCERDGDFEAGLRVRVNELEGALMDAAGEIGGVDARLELSWELAVVLARRR
ncbi:hypothetical protein V8E36_007029 [Tilletia maclaganii]